MAQTLAQHVHYWNRYDTKPDSCEGDYDLWVYVCNCGESKTESAWCIHTLKEFQKEIQEALEA